MCARYRVKGFVCVSGLAFVLTTAPVFAQIVRRPVAPPPVVNPQVVPVPGQAVQPQAPARADPTAAVVAPAPAAGDIHAQGRIIRGSQLIGLNIWGADNQEVGTVKDFIVDYQEGGCPMIYFAMEPTASLQLGQEYVILPLTAMAYRFDNRGGHNYFALNVNGRQLRNSPHIAVNNWSTFNDHQVLGNAWQFYQRIEHTAARPIQGGATQRDNRGAPEKPPRTRSAA